MLKAFIKKSAGSLFKNFVPKTFLEQTLTVFVFHDVSDNPSEFCRKFDLNVSSELFERQILLIKSKFNVVNPADLLKSGLPPRAALITFDDGFKNYFLNAIPIMERHSVPSIIFLNMAPVKGEIFWSGLITYLCSEIPLFHKFIKNTNNSTTDVPRFLQCSKELVETFLSGYSNDLTKVVSEFVGEFSSQEDLEKVAESEYVFFGNHLYNHYVPCLMDDKDFIDSFEENERELKKYENYCPMFAFPFGQPGSCYNEKQIALLIQHGSKKVFDSLSGINFEPGNNFYHRIPICSFHDSEAKIWYEIFRALVRK